MYVILFFSLPTNAIKQQEDRHTFFTPLRQKPRGFSWFVANKGGCRKEMRRKSWNNYDSVKIRHKFALSTEAKKQK